MASWLMHLRIAERIKQRIPGIDFPYFIIGSIAPDSKVPYESQENCTPSKDTTHCKYKNNAAANMDESVFFNKYLIPEKIIIRSDRTRSFLWGYYFHLIADKLWLDKYFKPFQNNYEIQFKDSDKDFEEFIGEEMISLDFEYLEKNGTGLIEQLESFDGNIDFFYEFDPEYIYDCKNRIIGFYRGEPLKLNRKYEYLSSEIVDKYITEVSDKCISILVI